MILRNVAILPQHYMASQPTKPRLEREDECVLAEAHARVETKGEITGEKTPSPTSTLRN
jgi:hypothetical protein